MPYRTAGDVTRLRLPQGKAEMFVFDAKTKGLSVRLHGASRSFVVWFTVAGKRKKITLGATDSMTLDEARRRAGEIVNAAREGRDASAERKAAKATVIYTVRDLVRDYLTLHAEQVQRPSTLTDTRRHLERHLAPLHALPVADLDRKAVTARLAEITRAVSHVRARAVRANLSAMFAWAMREGLADANPVVGTTRHKLESRDRVLSLDELAQVWAATADDRPYSKILRLLVLTGCRCAEVGGLMWAELEGDTWHLPASRSKNARARDIMLSRQAREIIDSVPRSGPYLFGRAGNTPFGGWSWSKARLDKLVPLPEWRVHDIRRSMATHMAERGVAAPHIIEAVLGHLRSGTQAGIAGIYNRATYVPEQRMALQHWADFMGSTTTDNGVKLKNPQLAAS